MHSDTESLAFMEEDDISPPPKALPSTAVPRPRIMAAPSPTPSKLTPAKPPLHHAVAPTAAAAGSTSAKVPVRGGLIQVAPKSKVGRQDTTSEFSDNDSVAFMVDNNSMSGTPMRGVNASFSQFGLPRPGAPRRLSRAASNSSIHFNMEPGSRSTSPRPKPYLSLRSSTPAEKALAPQSPPPAAGNKAQITNDSISFFFDHSDSSEHGAEASPISYSATARGHGGRDLAPATAAVAAPGHTGSIISNDSIAFQVDDDSGDAHGQAATSPSTTPLTRAATTTPSVLFSVKSDRPLAVLPANVADTSHSEFVDNNSIAFDVVEDATPAAAAAAAAKALTAQKANTTTSPPSRPSAIPYYSSHARRSVSAQSRPNSPSIQFETDHNSDLESTLDQSASQMGGTSPPVAHGGLPSFGQPVSPPTLPMPEVLKSGRTTKQPKGSSAGARERDEGSEAGGGKASTTRSSKKTIVTNHLQRRQQQQQRQPRQPSPQGLPNTRSIADGELSMTPGSTHPPLYQKMAVSTPIAAQAVGAATEAANDARQRRRTNAALGDRNLPRKKDPTAVLNLQRPQTRRSKESATTESQGVSPNGKLFTEAGSTGTTDSPPEPPQTGRHSRTSTEGHISARSLAQSSQRALSSRDAHSHSNSVRGYLENQEVENAYHRSEYTQHARQNSGTDTVLYKEVSPSPQFTEATAREAEQWRRFNDQQRAELAQLRHRIAQARRQDRTLLENSPIKGLGAASGPGSRRGGPPQPAPLALASLPGWSKTGPGYSDMKRTPSAHASMLDSATAPPPPSALQDRKGMSQSRPHSARPQQPQQHPAASSLYAKQMNTLVSTSARRPQSFSRLQESGAIADKASGRQRTVLAASRTAVSPRDLLHSDAAASVADLLGVLWPPRVPSATGSTKANRTLPFSGSGPTVDLYFVNGSRLTIAQLDRFLDLVQVQAEADETTLPRGDAPLPTNNAAYTPRSLRHFCPADAIALASRDGLSASPAKPQRAPLSAKLSALLPRKAVRRSRVMREVFDVMDLKHQGNLTLDLLPSLSRLFEGELAALEQARMSLLEGRATPLATLLQCAIASRQQYASAWSGGRGVQDNNVSNGLSQVLSSDGAGLTAEAQEELIYLTHRLLLLSFAVNVVIPVVSASRIPLLDFPALCMILYAAVDNVEHEMDSPREQWREVVQQYFILLDS